MNWNICYVYACMFYDKKNIQKEHVRRSLKKYKSYFTKYIL